jgi:hypothetical protein
MNDFRSDGQHIDYNLQYNFENFPSWKIHIFTNILRLHLPTLRTIQSLPKAIYINVTPSSMCHVCITDYSLNLPHLHLVAFSVRRGSK